MKDLVIRIQDLKSAFGFLPNLDVTPYGGRALAMDGPVLIVQDTGSIMREHGLWRKYGLGADRLLAVADPYRAAGSGRMADLVRRHVRGGGKIQFFYVGDAEIALRDELGIPTSAVLGSPSAEVSRAIECKISLHKRAHVLGIGDTTVVPHTICTTLDELRLAMHRLANANHTIPRPDFVVCKHAGWASGVGTALVRSDQDAVRYAAENMDGKTPILVEAGYAGIVDIGIQCTMTDRGIEHIYLNEQIIRNGVQHAGNLVVSRGMLPSLTVWDRRRILAVARHHFELWWQMGYRGMLGLDMIGIPGNDDVAYPQFSLDERLALASGLIRDWRAVDPNPRMTASQYPQSFLRQLEERFGGSWAVGLSNIWPASGMVQNFDQLERILHNLLPSGLNGSAEGVLPLMTGLLPNKFAVIAFARTPERASELLATVRQRVGDLG